MEKNLKRKLTAGLAACALTLGLLAGCGSSDDSAATKVTPAANTKTSSAAAVSEKAASEAAPASSAKAESSAKTVENLDIQEIADALKTKISYEDALSPIEDGMLDVTYPVIDTADVKKYAVYLSSGSTAEEVAAFEAKNEEAAGRIEEALKIRVEDQTDSFANYVPSEVDRLEDAVIVRTGKYVFLSVSGDPDSAKAILSFE